ncbi:MAG TPA: A/G-specific adenine glycosylase [Anaerolineae bacterium]|nr:A/G-specific adenine glycosylase [Anaerolineae bacterium]
MPAEWTQKLLVWYEEHARDLPWRKTRDPYAIWIAEVMLQQTRVETVIPYYERWMASFPTIEALADAPREQVLAHWEGLGYYRRAHHLHQAAQRVVEDHGGLLPSDLKDLEKLPGIGRYTAAAVAAIAYDHDVLALDGNLRRVLARLIDLEIDAKSSEGERRIREAGMAALPERQAGIFNQALMDLSSQLCRPRAPRCSECPLEAACLANQHGVQEQRPVRASRKPLPHLTAAVGVLHRDGKVLIGRRPEGGVLAGLWQFPGGRLEPGESLEACLRREWVEELGVQIEPTEKIGVYDHAHTNFRITVHAFTCRLLQGEPQALDHTEIRWVEISHLGDYPMGKIDRQISLALAAGGSMLQKDS